MKYLLVACIFLLGIYLGHLVTEYFRTPCPEVKESIEVVKKDLPEVFKVIEKPKPIKSYPVVSHPQDTIAVVSHICDSINEYSETLEDSTGKVTVESVVQGALLKQKIKFKPTINYIKETKEVEKPIPQSGIFIGAEIGTNLTMFRIAPEIEYLTKKGYAYSYNYDVLNSIHSVGVKRKLKF